MKTLEKGLLYWGEAFVLLFFLFKDYENRNQQFCAAVLAL
ncbi:MAG: hypothetical protein RL757_1764 [Bacteroidota bacterium]|jgi:hypothetical protein